MGKAERLHMKAVKEAARKAARGAVEEALRSPDVQKLLREIIGGVPAKNETKDSNRTQVTAETIEKDELERIEREVREALLEAGVRRQDLDWALSRFQKKVAELPEDKLATYEVETFVQELAKQAPQVFREGFLPRESAREEMHGEPAGNNQDTMPAKRADTGPKSDVTPKPKVTNEAFDAMKATPDQIRQRLEEIKALRGQPAN